jgi:hypothetical protein
MRKTLLFCAFILGACAVNAQFGIQAGASFYSEKAKFDGGSVNTDTKAGFTVGIVYSAPLAEHISFMPSLNFTQKGGKSSSDGETFKETLNYIDLPLNFVYNADGFFIGAGPALGVGISGKDKSDGESDDVKFGSGDDEVKRFEFSANIIAGYRLSSGLFISANYNPGISNLSNDSDTKAHNNGFGIRLGYMFGGMKKKSSSANQ